MENLASNTTQSNPSFHWVEGPKVRGTLEIFNLCLSTLIICVWNALHFDIPLKRQSLSRRFFFSLFWMFFALLAPEVLLFSAIRQRIAASTLAEGAIDHLPSRISSQPGVPTRVYNYFCRREKLKDNELQNLVRQTPSRRKYPFGLIHAFYAAMGGFIFDLSDDGENNQESAQPSTAIRDAPTAEAFLYIMQNFPDIVPEVSEESITERAESGGLSKAILIAQVGWFCANCASRLVERLPLSLLEVSTAAHCLCTLITYFVWWSKPHNVVASIPMHGQEAREVHALLKCTEDEYRDALEIATRGRLRNALLYRGQETTANTTLHQVNLAARALKHLLPHPPARPGLIFHDHSYVASPGYFFSSMIHLITDITALLLIPILYGSLHFLGWSEVFPSSNEHLFWGISTVMITSSGFLTILVGGSAIAWRGNVAFVGNVTVAGACGLVILMLHSLASGFLIVESVRQLFFLPSAAYEVASWSNLWPHFS